MVADAATAPVLVASWDAQSFASFYYDLKNDRSTEKLYFDQSLSAYAASRSVDKTHLWYTTGKAYVDFKVSEKNPGVGITSSTDTSYPLVGWMAEKWIAIKNNSNKIAKLAFEMDKEDMKTLTTGDTWALGSGYELTINAIDARTTPRQVWFILKKDGAVVDEGIGQAPASSTISDRQKAVYYKTKTILGESNALLFTVYVENIFSGATADMVQFKYAWLIDESSAKEIKAADTFGAFEVRTANKDQILLSNENSVSLSKNSETTLMGNLKFKVADSDNLRFYPFVLYTQPGTYEVRGSVADEGKTPAVTAYWYAQSFAGFYYDLKNNRNTELLAFNKPLSTYKLGRSINKNELEYRTGKIYVDFQAFEKEGIGITSSTDTNYPILGWMGEKWIAIKNNSNKIAKLALEMNKEDKKTLTTGETWSLGSGYELTLNAIDTRSTPRQAWFTLRKDGAVVDEGIGQAPDGSTVAAKQKAVYYKTKTILRESDALLFTVYVDTIFSGATADMVQFKYAWLIDESSVKEIKSADTYGVFEVRTANKDQIILSNENSVSLSKNSETKLLGNLKFKVADNDTLRFYPKIDYVINEISDDVNRNGTYTIGIYRPRTSTFFLRNSNSEGNANLQIGYGTSGDTPVVGDWDGDNKTTIGVYRPGTNVFYLRNSNSEGNADLTIGYGASGDIPVLGDWDGDGKTTIGVYRPSTNVFFLRNSNSEGNADLTIGYGASGDIPVLGDWDGDGKTTIGVYRPNTNVFYLRNSNSEGNADLTIGYGASGDIPVLGDWDGDGKTTIGVYRPSTNVFYLRNSNSEGNADLTIGYGASGDTPVIGDWDNQ